MMETKLPAFAAAHFGQKQAVRDKQPATVKAPGEQPRQTTAQDTFVRFGCGSCS